MCCFPTQLCSCCICLICVAIIIGGLFGFGVFSDLFRTIKHTVHVECDRNLQGLACGRPFLGYQAPPGPF
ncbi:hypothetical protein Pint_06412 [Pistacia integerrima]|uniref:Uncharacterized protein n=1 Tax=Pistacia integerrima TaxID=434235 RepID=A0ACC0Z7K8_9ROSI|nr:hypothetical protein Pint_06412 [Pistacia integerrima]